MVFVYLPFYFAAGVILFFVWRWLAPAFKAANASGSTSGAVPAILTVVFVIGLLGFAIGRATLPPSVFDLPVDCGRLWFAIPVAVVGVWAAAFFASASTRPKSATEPADAGDGGARGGDDEEWLRLDRSRALMVAAAALFLAFAALQYDYKLLGEVTKFSAGSIVSLELAQSPQKAAQAAGRPNFSGHDVAALPRTDAITYVTAQLDGLSASIEQDDRIASLIVGENDKAPQDEPTEALGRFFEKCGKVISTKLVEVQDSYKSEFPSINGVNGVQSFQTKSISISVQVPISLILRRVYDYAKLKEADNFKNSETYKRNSTQAVGDFFVALSAYEQSVDTTLRSLGDDPKVRSSGIIGDGDHCRDGSREELQNALDIYTSDNKSNMIGYFVALTALSEFADGNRESAIRLLDGQIGDELTKLHDLTQIAHKNAMYLEARKRAMITRLIRWQGNLVELVQTPERSAVLDQIQFNRVLNGMQYHPFGLIAQDPVKFVADVLGSNGGDCPKTIKLSGGRKIVLDAKWDRVSFYTSLYTEVTFMNNALDYISKNGGVVQSLTFGLDADLIKDLRQPISESDLIHAMDLVADRLLKLSQSDLGIGSEPLSCLAAADLGLPVNQTTLPAFLETVGDYFDSKGRNFGSSAGPQTSQYEDAASGPISRIEDRIIASCYAVKMYGLGRVDEFSAAELFGIPQLNRA
jgi:hypothetical protein